MVGHINTANGLLEGVYLPTYAKALIAVIFGWDEIVPMVCFH